jgi:hypothetical protein
MSEGVVAHENTFTQRLNEVEETLKLVCGKVDKIYDAVVGNEKFDQQGIIGRLKKIEQEIESYRTLKNKLTGAFIFGGAMWTLILEVVKYLLHK